MCAERLIKLVDEADAVGKQGPALLKLAVAFKSVMVNDTHSQIIRSVCDALVTLVAHLQPQPNLIAAKFVVQV